MRETLKAAIFHVILLCLVIAISSSLAHSAEPLDVRVKNFPDTQQVKGSVSIEGTVSHAIFVKREGLLLSTSRRNELNEMFLAGVIETGGFTPISVSLQGEIKSSNFVSGTIGVVLIPDEEPIVRTFREAKQIQFPIESMCSIKSGDSEYFSSAKVDQHILFQRYRIYLYNTLNRNAEANVYLYLSN